MKFAIFVALLIPILSYAGEEKSLSDLIDSNHVSNDGLVDASDINTGELLDTDDITLHHQAGDEGEFEARVEAMEASLFEGQAHEDANKNSCNKGRDEKIVCANIMCDFGLIMGEWPGECTDYKLKLAEVVAKTPPWKSLPKCFFVNKSCKNSGRAKEAKADEEYCNQMSDLAERHQCLLALDMTNERGATDYIERNGGSTDGISDIEFVEGNPAEVGTDFLVNHVDPRFNFEHELTRNYTEWYKKCSKFGFKFNCRWRERDTGIQPMAELNFYLEHRDDPAYASQVRQKRELLISKGTMLEHCANVPFDQFFNCNFYPDLPKQCWSAPSHEAIAECVEDQEIASSN